MKTPAFDDALFGPPVQTQTPKRIAKTRKKKPIAPSIPSIDILYEFLVFQAKVRAPLADFYSRYCTATAGLSAFFSGALISLVPQLESSGTAQNISIVRH